MVNVEKFLFYGAIFFVALLLGFLLGAVFMGFYGSPSTYQDGVNHGIDYAECYTNTYDGYNEYSASNDCWDSSIDPDLYPVEE